MSSRRSAIPTDSLLQLRQRLDRLPPKSPDRATQIAASAQLYGISVTTVYRALRLVLRPRTTHRRDRGLPRILPPSELEHYCELITATLVESVLSRQLDDLEPTLTRHGYRLKDMVEQFDAKPAEIRALFNNQLDPARTAELRDRMLAVGLPI